MAWPFQRRARGPVVAPNVLPPAVVFQDGRTNAGITVGPGGGYGWGAGPRSFVPWSRGPQEPIVELGRPGDFVEGSHEWGPAEGDLGFPHSTRWPGYPGSWEQPFYEAGADWRGSPVRGGRTGNVGIWPPINGGAGGAGPYGGFGGGNTIGTRVSTVFTCVDLISRTIASMDLSVTRDSAPQLAPAWLDNPEPEIYTSMVDAMKGVVNSLLLRGEAIIAPTARYGNGQVARWVVLNPDVVEITADKVSGMPRYFLGGVEIPRHELLHIRYQIRPGDARGVGPLEAIWRNLASAEALERWGTELATNGGIPTAVLQSAVKLTKPQTDDLKASWAEAAASRGVFPIILSGGLTYTPLNLKPKDIGLLDLRQFDEARIAAAFGVPLWLVGLPMQDGLTYSTVNGTFDYFWRATLKALVYNITSALSGWALPRGSWLRADSESLTRPGLLERAQSYEVLIRSGVMVPVEARVLENMAPVPPGFPISVEAIDANVKTLAVTTDGGI
jgi:HK97 family phage portal protein